MRNFFKKAWTWLFPEKVEKAAPVKETIVVAQPEIKPIELEVIKIETSESSPKVIISEIDNTVKPEPKKVVAKKATAKKAAKKTESLKKKTTVKKVTKKTTKKVNKNAKKR